LFLHIVTNNNSKMRYIFTAIAISLLLSISISCDSDSNKKELIIFNAGSLSVPFKEIKKEFEKENPDINVV